MAKPATLEFFPPRKTVKSGLNARCLACNAAESKKWRDANPEVSRASGLRWYYDNPEQAAEGRHKRRARLAGVLCIPLKPGEWEAKCENFGNRCAYCDRPGTPETLTRDHLHPIAKDGPDIYENIVPACLSCNVSKKDRTLFDVWVPPHSRHLYPARYA